MSPSTESDAAEAGVAAAWDRWLHDHAVIVPGLVEVAVAAAVTRWLGANKDEVGAAGSEAVAGKSGGGAG